MIKILINQVITMFLLMSVGYLLFRGKKISQEGSKTLGNILIFISLPCVIIKSFMIERTPEMEQAILLSAAAAFLSLLLAVVISSVFFRKDGIASFAGAFSNPGFFGVPLILACLDQGAVVYVAFYIAFLNLLQWSYGTTLLTGGNREGKLSYVIAGFLRKAVKAPFMIAILAGMMLFLLRIQVPEIVTKCVAYMAELNTPLAMFTVGVYMAQVNVLEMIRKGRLYLISAVKLIMVPAAVLLLLRFVMPQGFTDLKLAILIASACPVGSNIAVYAQLYDRDYRYAVETVVISTILSIITIPFLVNMGLQIFG